MSNLAVNRKADRKSFDFLRTPAIAVEKLLEVETFEGSIWEPACGDGAISEVLLSKKLTVASSDLVDRGYGQLGVDFLAERETRAKNIITNPPYNLAQQFVEHANSLIKWPGKIAFLLNLDFVKSKKRHPMWQKFPPSRIHVFSRQIAGDPRVADFMVKAWFVWDSTAENSKPELDWVL